MRGYGFSLIRILPYNDRIYDSVPDTREYGSVETRILANFLQCTFPVIFIAIIIIQLSLYVF